MADLSTSTIPKPPDSADIHEMQRWMKDIYTYFTENVTKGNQVTFFSANQISQMTDLGQAGKIFFNNDTGKFMGGEVSGGALSIKTFQTS